MKENDIYRWHWKEGQKPIIGCYAHLAVFFKGQLRDTYWHDYKIASSIDLDRVDLELLGNIDDYEVIREWDLPFYAPADIINMNHSNNSRAAIYLKRGASKSQELMLARAEEKLEEALRAKDRANRDIIDWEEKIRRICDGDLEVYL